MRLRLLTATGLFLLGAGVALGDEKIGTPGGPPPGKGKNKFVAPAPSAPSAAKPAPNQVADLERQIADLQKKLAGLKAAPKRPVADKSSTAPDDGIGQYVSVWARSGIHGPQLAARIHQLQATKSKAAPTPPTPGGKPGKPDTLPPAKPGKGKKKSKGD